MIAKDFVKSKYPNAWAEKITRKGPFKEFYWLVWSDFRSKPDFKRLGNGEENKPQTSAWNDAKNTF